MHEWNEMGPPVGLWSPKVIFGPVLCPKVFVVRPLFPTFRCPPPSRACWTTKRRSCERRVLSPLASEQSAHWVKERILLNAGEITVLSVVLMMENIRLSTKMSFVRKSLVFKNVSELAAWTVNSYHYLKFHFLWDKFDLEILGSIFPSVVWGHSGGTLHGPCCAEAVSSEHRGSQRRVLKPARVPHGRSLYRQRASQQPCLTSLGRSPAEAPAVSEDEAWGALS